MSKYKIKSGKGELVLRKSQNLVGLKTTSKRDIEKADYVNKKYLPNLGGFKVVSLDRKDTPIDDNGR